MKKIKTYKSGLRLAVETLNNFPSIVCSIRVGTGSINDFEGKSGISHFIEHMIFKGTKTKSASEIACCFEELGAEINAYTSQFFTNFYAKCVKEDVEKVFEQLCDIVSNSVFAEEEMKKEKSVVIEEIGMQEDEPFSVVTNLLENIMYTNPAMKHDILGDKKSVNSISRQDILEYIEKYYTANNMIVTFSGKISFEEAEELTKKYFEKYINSKENQPVVFTKGNEKLDFSKKIVIKDKHLEQAHVMIAYKTESLFCENVERYNVLSKILGESMSSRLFQAVREKLGLVYSIFSLNNFMTSCGSFVIYFATSPKNISKAISAIDDVLKEMTSKEVSKVELEKAKKLIANELIMSREKLTNVNSKISKDLFIFGKDRNNSMLIKRIKKVSESDLLNLSKNIFTSDRLVCVIGDNISHQIKTK